MSSKICPVCKNEFLGGEVFCPNDGGRLVHASQLSAEPKSDSGDPLIGMELLIGFDLRARLAIGGVVEIEAIP